MSWLRPKTLIATLGSVILPLLALAYLSSRNDKKSIPDVVIQVGIVIGAVVLFGFFLARLLEQMNAGRVARWIESDEGREWLESLPEEERDDFQRRFESFR